MAPKTTEIVHEFLPYFRYNYLVSLAKKANVIVVAIQYRRAPEHPLPIAYDDSWAQIQWVVSHVKGDGPEPWLNEYANFERVHLIGSSAGANIAHNMAIRVGNDGLTGGVKIVGMGLMHPYFGNNEPSKLMEFIFPSIEGRTDPRINPVGAGVDLASLGCTRLLICVASEDWLRDRGVAYHEALRKSGWPDGLVEIVETEGEGHVRHSPSRSKLHRLAPEYLTAYIMPMRPMIHGRAVVGKLIKHSDADGPEPSLAVENAGAKPAPCVELANYKSSVKTLSITRHHPASRLNHESTFHCSTSPLSLSN
ncbi:unnamed protein product [Dovyalis caffra]|uniref:Alpha/beta hydrolase fold-3 domain-containing protein n=1 Tax=Dovyalis caffra TaxID=77055 RepID=A0AAV1R7W3_9ROSI|nr:unnamed protein product [Dovyalis caffra]